jgi:phospholipid/cholesterol/gamma-HCH transport system substrate-binding protein
METRANLVIVGLFTLLAMAAAFAFVYWVARLDERGNLVPLVVRIQGSAAGLGEGSDVLFNGVKVGKVTRVAIDVNDPRLVFAHTEVRAETPIRTDTSATLGSQGLTGVTYIALKGGSPDAGLLRGADGKDAVIEAAPSALGDLTEVVRDLAGRANGVVVSLEGVIRDNREPLAKALKNAEKFTGALAANSEGVEKFMAGVSKAAESLDKLSTRLDASIAGVERLVAAVDPGKVRSTVDDVSAFAADLKGTSGDIKDLVASAGKAMGDLSKFSQGINASLANVDKLVAALDADKVRGAVDDVAKAAAGARAAVDSAAGVTEVLSRRREDIDGIVTDLSQFAERINAASARVDGVLSKLDGFLGTGDAKGVMEELRLTLSEYRTLGETLNARVAEIAGGLAKFSNRGLDDVRALVQETRQSMARIDRAISEFESNPQRLIFGGEQVRQYTGRPRR